MSIAKKNPKSKKPSEKKPVVDYKKLTDQQLRELKLASYAVELELRRRESESQKNSIHVLDRQSDIHKICHYISIPVVVNIDKDTMVPDVRRMEQIKHYEPIFVSDYNVNFETIVNVALYTYYVPGHANDIDLVQVLKRDKEFKDTYKSFLKKYKAKICFGALNYYE